MTNPTFPPPPTQGPNPSSLNDAASVSWMRGVIDVVRNMLGGKLNVVFPVTLAANATTTTITDPRIGVFSSLLFSPTSATAATAPTNTTASSWIGRQVITGTATYTPTAGTAMVDVTIIGGGGAGGSVPATGAGQVAIGSAAGAGGGSRKRITSAFSGVTVTIGDAGAPGAAGSNPGGNGGNSTFGAILTANGGSGAAAGFVDSTSVVYFIDGAPGGTASGGDINISGQNGAALGNTSTSAGVINAAGGSPPFGLGVGAPPKVSLTGAAGGSGTGYGAGGSGALNDHNQVARQGGAGTAGICIIDEYSAGSAGSAAGVYVVSQGSGTAVIGHDSSAATDRTFNVVILG